MGHQIIEQPNGKFCLWSSIVDDFIMLDATPDDIIKMEVEEASDDINRRIHKIIDQLDRGEKPYYQHTMTYDEAMQNRRTK